MIKKIVVLFLFISTFAFAETNYAQKILQNRVNIIETFQMFKQNNESNLKIIASVIDADEILKQTVENDIKFSEFVLIFPSVDYVEKYIDTVSKNVNKITMIFLADKTDEIYMESRDYETLKQRNIKIPENVKVHSVKVDKIDVAYIFPNSITKKISEDEIMNKYVKNIIEKNEKE